jgi:hypothetical protein
MKKLALSFLVVALLLSGTAAGQSNGQSKSTKSNVSTISGKVSQDGKGLIEKNDQPWSVANPGLLAGHEGQQVKVKCQISSGSHEMFVLSVKMVATQAQHAVNLGDAAFRR